MASTLIFTEDEVFVKLGKENKLYAKYNGSSFNYSKKLKEKLIQLKMELPFLIWLKVIEKCK